MGATCCVRLATQLRRVATCWVLKIELIGMPGRHIAVEPGEKNYNINQHLQLLHKKNWPFWNLSQQHPTDWWRHEWQSQLYTTQLISPRWENPIKERYMYMAPNTTGCVFVTGTIVCRKLSGLIGGRTLECVSVWTCRWLGSHFCFCIRPRQHYVGEI